MADKTFTFNKFSGVNNRSDPKDLGADEFVVGENVDLNDNKKALLRAGTTSVYSGDIHSLWSQGNLCFFVEGTALKRLVRDSAGTYTTSTLRNDMTPGAEVSYTYVNGDVYYSNIHVNGMIRNGVNRAWGVEVPGAQPTLSATAGGLASGTYQIAITFVDSDGREGGAVLAAPITTSGGVTLTGIPVSTDSDITSVRIYMTTQNGDTFYRAKTVANGTTTTSITTGIFTILLVTQFLSVPPLGSIVRYCNGRVYVVVQDAIYESEPFSYHLFNIRKGFYQFAENVGMLAPVEDGAYVSADKLYWIPFGMEDPPRKHLGDYKAIPRTDVVADGEDIGKGSGAVYTYFFTDKGYCLGGPGGAFKNLTNSKLSPAPATSGAGSLQ